MRILIVEDEEDLALQIQHILLQEKYTAEIALDGKTGLKKAQLEEYDLLMLDVMLPGMDGFSVLKELRSDGVQTPVIMLTARVEVDDRVTGLDLGADDYLTKPFAVPELLARIRSLLRRDSTSKSAILTIGDVNIDTEAKVMRFNNSLVELTAKEYAIIEFLFYNANRVVSRVSIAEHIWGDSLDLFTMTNFVDVHIKNIRKKMKQVGAEKIIYTIRGIGYIAKDPE